jgi:hypothetical protein
MLETAPMRLLDHPSRLALMAALCLAQASPGLAQSRDFAGRWAIAKAAVAPWADPAQPGGGEESRLVGRTVTFSAYMVIAPPPPLGCRSATFAIRRDTADRLFEGALAEPDVSGKPRNALALAQALGMTTPTVATLETSCSEVAFHRLSPATLVFGLNDRIYTLHRASAGR